MRLKKLLFRAATKKHFEVWRGITPTQIEKLIFFTHNDQAIQKFTHDKKRFRNKKTFAKWAANGKVIYTMVGHNQSLVGIIWFSKKSFLNYDYTFAIRIYQTARGKNLAKKFMAAAFADFKAKSIWLRTSKDNLIALKLYKNFGFKKVQEDERYIYMALT